MGDVLVCTKREMCATTWKVHLITIYHHPMLIWLFSCKECVGHICLPYFISACWPLDRHLAPPVCTQNQLQWNHSKLCVWLIPCRQRHVKTVVWHLPNSLMSKILLLKKQECIGHRRAAHNPTATFVLHMSWLTLSNMKWMNPWVAYDDYSICLEIFYKQMTDTSRTTKCPSSR